MTDSPAPASRVGHLNPGGDFSGLVPATLDEHDRGGLHVRVPYLVGNFPERWFWNGLMTEIRPGGEPIAPEPVPTDLDYFDNNGSVGLVGCSATGQVSMRFGGFSASAGVGEIEATFAVINATSASNYRKINGFRSEIDGLGYWLNLWAHRTAVTWPEDGSPPITITKLELPANVQLARRLNLCATVRGTAPGKVEPEVRYTSTALLQTYSTRHRDWSEHLDLHKSIRDLLRVAVWKPIVFLSHEVTSDKEKVGVTEDADTMSRWCEAKTASTGIGPTSWGKNEQPLFIFADIGPAGIQKWLKFEAQYRRGLAPFLRLLDIREGTIDEHVTQLGIAIEAFGYQAFRDGGSSIERADRKTMAQRVRKLALAVEGCVANVPRQFPEAFADGYNAVKHANRPVPDPSELISNYRLAVTIIRAWIALRLGLPREIITKRLR